jgi:hypothetical protein
MMKGPLKQAVTPVVPHVFHRPLCSRMTPLESMIPPKCARAAPWASLTAIYCMKTRLRFVSILDSHDQHDYPALPNDNQ